MAEDANALKLKILKAGYKTHKIANFLQAIAKYDCYILG